MHLPQSALLDRAGASLDALISARIFGRRDLTPFASDSDSIIKSLAFSGRGGGATYNSAWATSQAFTPSFTGITNVGSPTYTGRFVLLRPICFFQASIVPSTTTATIAGTTYMNLPLTATGINGDGSMENLTTLIAIGMCAFDITNSRCYLPSQGATGNTLEIGGWFEAL